MAFLIRIMSKVTKIGILTSGGDAPGMNAALRAVVRSALYKDVEVDGIFRGFAGLLKEEFEPLSHRSVANIVNRGGTILKTARSQEFSTPEGVKKGAEILRKHHIDCLIVCGGDGSYRGAADLWKLHGFPTIGIPGTIDNDLYGTDETIGCYTAVNTALEAIDKVRDTAHSMERVFIIEVMGNRSGYIAAEVALGAGAEEVIVPERPFDYEKLYQRIEKGHARGKISWMVVVAEGAGKAHEVAQKITEVTGFETRFVVLGHVQRGGNPSGQDRILALRLGTAAVDLAIEGKFGKAVGIVHDELNIVDITDAKHKEFKHLDEFIKLVTILT